VRSTGSGSWLPEELDDDQCRADARRSWFDGSSVSPIGVVCPRSSGKGMLPPEIGTYFRGVARDHGDGWRLPGGEGQLDLWGLKPGEARDFVHARLCDFSLRCFEEPLRLPDNRKASIPATFVASVAEEYPARPFFAPFAEKARASGWKVAELKTGHDCHVECPGEVANILLSAATSQ
jgi:hypothetical protein